MSGRRRARWDWYRLTDDFADTLVSSSRVGHGDLVLDLGAGDGAITSRLAATGARVIAFELHPGRSRVLRERFDDDPRVKVVRADITDLRLPSRDFHVVANPPFGCVSTVLSNLFVRRSRLATASLIVPVAVAARWEHKLARPGVPWSITTTTRVPRSAFHQRPRIDCTIIRVGR